MPFNAWMQTFKKREVSPPLSAFLPFITLLFISGCDSSPQPLPYGEINVEVWQHGKKIQQTDNTYELSKEGFDIRIEFSGQLNTLISADYRGDLYDQIQRGTPFTELQGFHVSGMAEGLRNELRSVTLSKRFPSVWFYDDPEENRCNEIIDAENRIICVRTIENISFQESRTMIPIEEFSHSFIYMSLFPYDYEPKTRKFTQLNETSFRLSFRY